MWGGGGGVEERHLTPGKENLLTAVIPGSGGASSLDAVPHSSISLSNSRAEMLSSHISCAGLWKVHASQNAALPLNYKLYGCCNGT